MKIDYKIKIVQNNLNMVISVSRTSVLKINKVEKANQRKLLGGNRRN